MDIEAALNNLSYIEDLQKVDENLLEDQNFIEQVLHKFGRFEDFSPDQILDYASPELKENADFIFSCFLKVIDLEYSKNYLYSNHQETISYFFDSHVSPLLKKNEDGCIKLVQSYCGRSLLNDPDFLKDVQKNNEIEWDDLGADTTENLKEFLLRKTITETIFHSSASFIKIIDAAGWSAIKYLPEQFKNNEDIYVHALKKNVKAKEFIPSELQEKSEVIKSILNDKNSSKDKRAKTKAFAELLLSDPEKFTTETRGMKFTIDLKKLKELPDKVAEALGKHNGNVNLSGISELSDKAACCLQSHLGELNLSNLTIISENGARYLLNHSGKIRLHEYHNRGYVYLFEIGTEVAKLIQKCYGVKRYQFKNITTISSEVVRLFGDCSVTFNDSMEITDEVLDAIIETTGEELALSREHLNEEIALKLSNYRGSTLCCFNIRNLSQKAAIHLSQFKGDKLHFNNRNWSEKIRGINNTPLTDHEKKSWIDYNNQNPTWLSYLSEEIAEALSKFKGKEIRFDNPTGVSDEAISHLVKFNGIIYLTGAFEFTRASLDLILKAIIKSKLSDKGVKEIVITPYTAKSALQFPELLDTFKAHIFARFDSDTVDLSKGSSSSIIDKLYIR